MPSLETHDETDVEIELARRGHRILSRYEDRRKPLAFALIDGKRRARLELPPAAVSLLSEMLEAMSVGQDVTLMSSHAELSTSKAAAYLNVSRPHVVKLLENGDLPFRKVGKHRRIRKEDLFSYMRRAAVRRDKALTDLTRQAQRERMGYSRK